MKNNFFVVAAFIIGSQLFLDSDLRSQENADSIRSLDEAVITANKFLNKTSLTGKVVTIITRQQLEKAGGRDLSQVLQEQAGLLVTGANSNAAKDKSIFLRGAAVEHTLITIDGIPLYDPSGIGGNFDIRNFSIDNIERIEILKGSQSTLYGSDAVAGVINIITRKTSVQKTNGHLKASYGSNQSIRANSSIYGRLGKTDYDAAYGYYSTCGINEAIFRNNPVPPDYDQYIQHNVQAGLGIHPNENIRIQPFLRYTYSSGSIDQGAFVDELDYDYTQKSLQAGLRNEIRLKNSRLTILYQFNTINRIYVDDSTKSKNGFDDYVRGAYEGSEHFAEAYWHGNINNQVKLTTGIDFRSSASDQEYFSTGDFGPFLSKNSHDSLNQRQWALYAALNWNHPKGFNLEIGGRLNLHNEYGVHPVFNFNPSYFFNRSWKIFSNISSAYRTPSLYQLFSEFGNRELEPESAISYEGGLQFFSKNEKFSARAVAFARSVKDLMFFSTDPVSFKSKYINQDRQKDQGLELEAFFKINKSISAKAFYTYTTGEITTTKNGKDTTYFNLLRRPESAIGMNLSSQLTARFYVSTNVQYIGERKDAYYDISSFSVVNTVLHAYALWDLYMDYAILESKLKVFADLRNISSARYTEIAGFNTMRFNGYGGVRFNF